MSDQVKHGTEASKEALATTPAWRSRKWLLGASRALLGAVVCLSVGVFFGHRSGKEAGIKEGIDMYHQMCYTVGGITVDEHGNMVVCAKIGAMPKKELDKELRARYNN